MNRTATIILAAIALLFEYLTAAASEPGYVKHPDPEITDWRIVNPHHPDVRWRVVLVKEWAENQAAERFPSQDELAAGIFVAALIFAYTFPDETITAKTLALSKLVSLTVSQSCQDIGGSIDCRYDGDGLMVVNGELYSLRGDVPQSLRDFIVSQEFQEMVAGYAQALRRVYRYQAKWKVKFLHPIRPSSSIINGEVYEVFPLAWMLAVPKLDDIERPSDRDELLAKNCRFLVDTLPRVNAAVDREKLRTAAGDRFADVDLYLGAEGYHEAVVAACYDMGAGDFPRDVTEAAWRYYRAILDLDSVGEPVESSMRSLQHLADEGSGAAKEYLQELAERERAKARSRIEELE